jgi:hypothetical protein
MSVDLVLLGLGIVAGASTRLRDLPLAAISLGAALGLASLRIGGFW